PSCGPLGWPTGTSAPTWNRWSATADRLALSGRLAAGVTCRYRRDITLIVGGAVMDRRGLRLNGFVMLLLSLVEGYAVFELVDLVQGNAVAVAVVLVIGVLIFVGLLSGLVVVNPNQAK